MLLNTYFNSEGSLHRNADWATIITAGEILSRRSWVVKECNDHADMEGWLALKSACMNLFTTMIIHRPTLKKDNIVLDDMTAIIGVICGDDLTKQTLDNIKVKLICSVIEHLDRCAKEKESA